MDWKISVGYLVAVFGGWIFVGLAIKLMLATISSEYSLDKSQRQNKTWRASHLWVGGIERAIAFSLVLYAAPLLPPFVGGWTALKFASNWGRPDRTKEDAASSFVFLVGSALSFGLAILIGLCFNPDAIDVWAKPGE